MQHKVKVTVIDKKVYPELQKEYCTEEDVGMCSCYHVGDTFIFERYGLSDDFWHMGINTLRQTVGSVKGTAGGIAFPHCSEAWDAISRYIYTGLQGGSIMRGWMKDERVMIACCSDGTRPVIFKIERMDYKVLYIDGVNGGVDRSRIQNTLARVDGVTDTAFQEDFLEVYLQEDVADERLRECVEGCGEYRVAKID